MSFQDMGKRGNAGGGSRVQRSTTTPQSFAGKPAAPASGGSVLGQISEGLNQYQRNVGILDKIVQQLGIARKQGVGSTNMKELQVQYDVQVDVVTQLEERVNQQLTMAQSSAPQIVKLKRDFERVQMRVKNLKSEAEKLDRQTKITGGLGGGYPGASPVASQNADSTDSYQLVQLQMQQDRLAEEIMREREEEIRNINRGMHQVNEIYKDLAHIVGSQQEQIDTIETQMEESRANAEQGLKQVEKANEKYGNSQCTIS